MVQAVESLETAKDTSGRRECWASQVRARQVREVEESPMEKRRAAVVQAVWQPATVVDQSDARKYRQHARAAFPSPITAPLERFTRALMLVSRRAALL